MKYFELLEKIYYEGEVINPRGQETKELRNIVLELENYNAVSVPEFRDWKDVGKYLYAEIAWYMTGNRKLDKIRPYSKFWDKITNKDGTINSNYGDLVFYRRNSKGWSSYDWAYTALVNDENTRQGIILYNDRELFYDGNKDLICNQYQQFFIRNNTLHCTVAIRSSDAIYGLTFNMPWWSFVHQMLFLDLKTHRYPNLKLGGITAFIGSSHIYKNKYGLVYNMLTSQKREYRMLRLKEWVPLCRRFEQYQNILKESLVCDEIMG